MTNLSLDYWHSREHLVFYYICLLPWKNSKHIEILEYFECQPQQNFDSTLWSEPNSIISFAKCSVGRIRKTTRTLFCFWFGILLRNMIWISSINFEQLILHNKLDDFVRFSLSVFFDIFIWKLFFHSVTMDIQYKIK